MKNKDTLKKAALNNAKIEAFFTKQKRTINVMELYGPYPLHKVAELGYADCLFQLLEYGFSPNSTNYDCLTPLHTACNHNELECAKILIQYGAKVNATSIDGGTPLCDACAIGSVPCVELLLLHGADVNPPLVLTTPLHEACIKGSLGCTSLLIDAGARLNVNDCHFGPPLHAAAMMNHPECVRKLLEAGAAVNATKIHQTALHIAASCNFFEVAKVLLEYGANVYASNNQNKLPFELLPAGLGQLHELLVDYATNPRLLSECCRKTIRNQLGPHRLKFIPTLKLPNAILAFIAHCSY